MYSHAGPIAASGIPWMEPVPREANGAHGVALAATPSTSAVCWLTTPGGAWYATVGANDDLSSRLISLSYHVGPEGGKCRLALDNDDAGTSTLSGLVVGGTLTIFPGYRSGAAGAAEYGVAAVFTVDEIRARAKDGHAFVEVVASTPWEQLARWEPAQTWQCAAGSSSRATIAGHIAGRAGFPLTSASAPMQPSNDLTAQHPAFSVAPTEHGDAALKRLLQVPRTTSGRRPADSNWSG